MKSTNLAPSFSDAKTAGTRPQVQTSSRAYQRRLQFNADDLLIGDVISDPVMGQLRHASALRGLSIPDLISTAVADWLEHPAPVSTPKVEPAHAPPFKLKPSPSTKTAPPKDSPLSVAREHFCPAVYGIGYHEIDLPTLALFVVGALHPRAALLRRVCIDAAAPDDEWHWCHCGDLAELLAICAEVFDKMEDGFRWLRAESFHCVGSGLASMRELTAPDFLEHSASTLLPWFQRLGDAALTTLAPNEALPLLETLCALEEIAHEWSGLLTDLEKAWPSRLQVAAARTRCALHTPHAA